MFHSHGQSNPAPRRKLCGNDRVTRHASFHKIIQNSISDRFVEGANIAIGGEIELERFAFDAKSIGLVLDCNPGEISLACDGTQRSKVVCVEMNLIRPTRWIRESLETRPFG